jgi:hypothetical protein
LIFILVKSGFYKNSVFYKNECIIAPYSAHAYMPAVRIRARRERGARISIRRKTLHELLCVIIFLAARERSRRAERLLATGASQASSPTLPIAIKQSLFYLARFMMKFRDRL